MPTPCKDANGNIVDCNTIKGNYKPSDDLSKGTEMKKIYTPVESKRKDPGVYDALKKEIESGFAESKYGFTGNNLNDYIKAKRTKTLYRNPSKNNKQNETLEIIKRGGFINTSGGGDIEKVPVEKETEKSIDRGEGKKIKVEIGKGKTNKPKGRRSLFNAKLKNKKSRSKNSLYKCKKKGCVAKGERSIKNQMKKRR